MRDRLIRRRGFTLIETLVAFAILTLALGQLLTGVGAATRNEMRADFLLRATREGRSQLDALGLETSIAEGQTEGSYDDGLIWSLSVGPARRLETRARGPTISSYWVRLRISRPSLTGAPAESLTLSTLKVVIEEESRR